MHISEPQPRATPYDLMGGQAVVFALVDKFYDRMDEVPEYYGIRKLHPASLEGSRDKLKWFLSGWLGGPQLYTEKFGHPMLRARHLPFPIGVNERDQWLACMFSAMEALGLESSLQTRLQESFFGTADWMRNQQGA
jgi:hemoglobin